MLKVSLGIDTSNYKTSVAMVTETGETICNLQQYLDVKKGERGLRQSVALFQHVNNLPGLIEKAFSMLNRYEKTARIGCVSVSSRPRPIEGSYMPCFLAGVSQGKSLAAALSLPYMEFSHQEGHIEAVRKGSAMEESRRFISFHFSGGTTEALLASEDEYGKLSVEIIGGSKDLAFGQVLDRVGVSYGMEFPCGAEMDSLAGTGLKKVKDNLLPVIKCADGYINLSGIETKCQRMAVDIDKEVLIPMLFDRISRAIAEMIVTLSETYGTKDILLAGGVSASTFIRNYLTKALPNHHICFGAPELSTDNAVGTALLGGKKLWR